MAHTLTQLLDCHSSTGLRGHTCFMGPVAAAVIARLMDWEGGLCVFRGLSHFQKLIITFPPQQEGHAMKPSMAQQLCLQTRRDPGHGLS